MGILSIGENNIVSRLSSLSSQTIRILLCGWILALYYEKTECSVNKRSRM